LRLLIRSGDVLVATALCPRVEVWVVPAGTAMGVETGRYSVVLHVVAFRVAAKPPG
jgi:hypothetical protein